MMKGLHTRLFLTLQAQALILITTANSLKARRQYLIFALYRGV